MFAYVEKCVVMRVSQEYAQHHYSRVVADQHAAIRPNRRVLPIILTAECETVFS